MNTHLKTFSLRLMSALTVLMLAQCTWPEPRYQARYEGPATPRRCYRDPIFGEPFYGYVALKCVASSPAWARLHVLEEAECYPCPDSYEDVALPTEQTVVVNHTSSTKTSK